MIDFAKITVTAGNGGAGKVAWRQDKFVRKGGPDGGNGGRGGSVWLEVDPDLNTLKNFQFQKKFRAESGQMGGKAKRTGRGGTDLVIKVPVGTVVKTEGSDPSVLLDLVKPGEKICVARGGSGGRGNWVFRSPTNTTPKTAEPGGPGETKTLTLELKLLADVGLIGLPNAGKSTLLSVLTKARPKIADYPFTTLEPNLGVMEGSDPSDLVIADIPGLIEGASRGKGLGIEFLRHVERCRVLVHVLDGSKYNVYKGYDFYNDYLSVRKELGQYSPKLLAKPEIIVLNKIDLVPKLPKLKLKYIPISAASHKNLDRLKRMIQLVLTGL